MQDKKKAGFSLDTTVLERLRRFVLSGQSTGGTETQSGFVEKAIVRELDRRKAKK